MVVKKIHGASLKVQIFLYYACLNNGTKGTKFLPDFEQDMSEFEKAGAEKVRRGYEEDDASRHWTFEEYAKCFNWVATSEAKILADLRVREVRDELVAEGFLWKKVRERPWGVSGKGKVVTTYVGLTKKGLEWAPKYIAKYGRPVVEK